MGLLSCIISLVHHFRLLLRNQAQFRRLEGARLRHRVFHTVQAVQNQIAEERVARHPGRVDVLFALVVDEEHMVAAVALRANVPILADFDVPLRSDDGAPVAPPPQAVRREPVHTEVERRAVCTVDGAVGEIIEFRILRVRVVGNAAAGDCAVLSAHVVQILSCLFSESCHPAHSPMWSAPC